MCPEVLILFPEFYVKKMGLVAAKKKSIRKTFSISQEENSEAVGRVLVNHHSEERRPRTQRPTCLLAHTHTHTHTHTAQQHLPKLIRVWIWGGKMRKAHLSSLSLTLTRAPLCSSCEQIAAWPLSEAIIKGVRPSYTGCGERVHEKPGEPGVWHNPTSSPLPTPLQEKSPVLELNVPFLRVRSS